MKSERMVAPAAALGALALAAEAAAVMRLARGIDGRLGVAAHVLQFAGHAAVCGLGLRWWARSPSGRMGPLLWLTGVHGAVVVAAVTLGLPDPRVEWTPHEAAWAAYAVANYLSRPLWAWLVLSWPTGRPSRGERALVLGVAAAWLLPGVGSLLVYEPAPGLPGNLLLVRPHAGVYALLWYAVGSIALPGSALVVAGALVRRRQRHTGTARRLSLYGLAAGVGGFAVPDLLWWLPNAYAPGWLTADAAGSVPTTFGAAVAVVDAARYVVFAAAFTAARGLMRRLAEAPRGGGVPDATSLQAALAGSLGDPSVSLAFPRRDGAWVDAAGRDIGVHDGPGRARTIVVRGSERVALIEHDEALADVASVVEAAAAAAALLIEHGRLEALALARLLDLERLRVQIVGAEDAARRRLERDLHDGAQQRIVSLAFAAGMLRRRMDSEAPGSPSDPRSAAAEIESLRAGVLDAADELVAFARGLPPSLVAEHGLGDSLRALAQTAPVHVDVDSSDEGRHSPEVQHAVWFVASEALTNAVKHAAARQVRISVLDGAGALELVVADDGRGGADPEGGGLRGLRERVARLNGSLEVRSPHGSGTLVRARIPST